MNSVIFPKPIDGYIFIMAGFRPNNGGTLLTCVSGSPDGSDMEIRDFVKRMASVAKREWLEETGIFLAGVEYLATIEKNWGRTAAFLGYLKEPLETTEQNLDPGEETKIIAMPWKEWVTTIEHGNTPTYTIKDAGAVTTYIALRKLGFLKT